MVLHVVQESRWFEMSAVMPGQKTDASALACIIVVPWWAECKLWRQIDRRDAGMTTRSLYSHSVYCVEVGAVHVEGPDGEGHVSLFVGKPFLDAR